MGNLRHHFRHITWLLRKRGTSPEDAEDLVQEAMLRLHAYTREGREVRDEESFITRTAMNLAVDAHRHAHVDLWESTPVEKLNLTEMHWHGFTQYEPPLDR